MRKIIALFMALTMVFSIGAVPTFAADITPTTIVGNSNIGQLNIQNAICSFLYGDESGGADVIAPTAIVENISAAVVNIINNIVDVDIKVGENLVKNILKNEFGKGGTGLDDIFGSIGQGDIFGGVTDKKDDVDDPKTEDNTSFSKEARTILRLCNQARREEGLAPLKLDSDLCEMAEYKSKDMARSGFAHTGSYGDLGDLLDMFDISYSAAGENIAYGTTGGFSIEDIFEGWMNSSGHRANILSKNFTRLGFGMYVDKKSGKTYYTQEFAG